MIGVVAMKVKLPGCDVSSSRTPKPFHGDSLTANFLSVWAFQRQCLFHLQNRVVKLHNCVVSFNETSSA